MQLHGFQGTRPDKVIQQLGITKGALYHYFPGKKELGYAVVEEVIEKNFLGAWRQIDDFEGNPIDFIKLHLDYLYNINGKETVCLGCPLNNLIQEMSPLDEGFRTRLKRIVEGMAHHIEKALRKGQNEGILVPDFNTKEMAYFIVSSIEGSFGIAKVHQDQSLFKASLDNLGRFLETLKK